MKIVIDIPEEMWERVKVGYVPLGISKHLMNGTPYPKDAISRLIEDRIEQESIIEKIRSEIMSKDGLEEALEIIDMYRQKGGEKHEE